MTFIYTMQVFLYIVKSLHKMITTIKMWKTFPMPSKKTQRFGRRAETLCQPVKKLPRCPRFLYNKGKGALSWNNGERMPGESRS